MNRTVLWVMVCNGLVAVAAFLKDVLLARYVGTSAEADAFTLSYFIADTVAGSWLSASLAAAAVTVYSKIASVDGLQHVHRVWGRSTAVFSLFAAMTIVVLVLITQLIFEDGLIRSLMTTMSPIILIMTVFATVTAYLQAANRFIMPAAAPLLMHVLFLLTAFFVTSSDAPVQIGLNWIAGSVTAGALIMLALTGYFIFSRLPHYKIRDGEADKLHHLKENRSIEEIWKIFGAYSLLTVSAQAILFWERGLGALLDVGIVSAINYAFRVSQVPVWVFATAVAAVILPKLTGLVNNRRLAEAKKLTNGMLQLVIIVTLPVVFSLWLLSEPVVAVLFQRGQFTWHSVDITSRLLSGYALSILGYSLSAILLRYWLASGKVMKPAGFIVLSTLATMALQWMLVRAMGAEGIAYGSAAGAALQAFLLAFPLVKGQIVSLRLHSPKSIVIASGFLLCVLFAGKYAWNAFSFKYSEAPRIVFLFGILFVGFVIYAAFVSKTVMSLARNISKEW